MLIVDDDPRIREFVRVNLEMDGYAVREAVADRIDTAGWVRELSLVQDAAFYNYARGATDYSP